MKALLEIVAKLLGLLFPNKAEKVRSKALMALPEIAKRQAERKRKRDSISR